jgi:hypothetical protein
MIILVDRQMDTAIPAADATIGSDFAHQISSKGGTTPA